MSATDPLRGTYENAPHHVSKKVSIIAGIKCTVYGLSELSSAADRVACVWLLNPRMGSQESMDALGHNVVDGWNRSQGSKATPGLIAVAFDQRNHGTRLVDKTANGSWRDGNGLHAQDMFSIYHGTALDVSQLISYLPCYVFPEGDRVIDTHLTLGVSLGGHCVWHCMLQDPRIVAGVVVVGCPDYLKLMTDRARLSKLATYTSTDPPGASFVGSKDFPTTLLDNVDLYDPAGLLTRRTMPMHQADIIGERLGGKMILNLAGGSDPLVPYAMGKPFLDWFKGMIGPQGAAAEHNVYFVDKVYDGVKHEMTADMVADAIRFIEEALKRHPSHPGDGAKL